MPADPPILLAAIGSLGDLHPCLALALRERGHRAVIAATPEQEAAIGHQSGGRVFLFLHADDFWRDYHALREKAVRFARDPREESCGTVAVFLDLCGNLWDLVQLRHPS